MIGKAIQQLVKKEDLSLELTKQAMDQIMTGKADPVQIASFLVALRMKEETIEEITAAAMVMREHCKALKTDFDVLDIVGTGGDEANTFNISTVSAFIIAAAGFPVAKHGNRSVSSKCGSADLLEALGVKLELEVKECSELLKKSNICFLFAPVYHASMRYAAPVRRELGIRTIFNILGPLANPASASLQLLGVYQEELVMPLARVLANLGVKRGMVVHGHDGLDELSLTAPSTVCEIKNGELHKFIFDPAEYGFSYCQPKELVGGDPKENAVIAERILNGEKGPKRDIVILNSALALAIADGNLSIREAIDLARQMIDSGKAKAKMQELIELSQRLSA